MQLVQRHIRHALLAQFAACCSVKLDISAKLVVSYRLSELLRHKCQQRFNLPLAGGETHIHLYLVAQSDLAVQFELKLIDGKLGFVQDKVHLVEVGCYGSVERKMQLVGVGLAFELCTHVVGIKSKKHIVPRCSTCRKCCSTYRGINCILGIHKGDGVGLQAQTIDLQFVERQLKRSGIFFHRIGRGNEHCEVVLSVRIDEEVHRRTVEDSFVDVKILVLEKLLHIDCCHQMFGLHNRVVLRSLHRIDEQQTVRPQSEAREGREERQVHLAYLILTGDELTGCLACYRRQFGGSEHHVHRDASNSHHSQQQTAYSPTDDFQCAFHLVSASLVKLNLIFSRSFS